MSSINYTSNSTGNSNFIVIEDLSLILSVSDTFEATIANLNRRPYLPGEWERVKCTYLGNNEFSRDTVIYSSSNGNFVDFTTGEKTVTVVLETGGSGTPGGSNGQIQVNDSGSFGGFDELIYDSSTNTFIVGNTTVNVSTNSTSITLSNSTATWSITKPTVAQISTGNYILQSDGTWAQPAGGVTNLDGLSDVTITTVADNQLLIYDSTAGVWENHDVGNGLSIAAQVFTVDGANGISVTADGVNVLAGNSQLVSNSTGIWVIEGQLQHDNLAGFVGDEHVAHSGVDISAGNGLTGGGTIDASRSFAVVGANGISVTAAGVNVLAGNSQVVANSTGVWIIQSNIDHDSLAGYVADEHVAHSGVDITAGAGLTGGGNISASRTLDVGAGNGITVAADAISVDGANGISVTVDGVNVLAGNSQLVSNATGVWIIEGQINHDNLAGFVGNEHIDHSTVSITAGDGLTGGGTITSTVTLDVGAGNGITVAADAISVDGANGISVTLDGVNVLAGNTQLVSNATGVWVIQSNIDHDLLANFVADEHVAHSGVDITAGAGLTGGGNISASRTLDVGAGNGITVAADAVAVDGANGISVTLDGVNVDGGSTLTVNTTGAHVNSALVLPTSITIGTGAENTVLTTSSLTLQNSTVTFAIPKPTAAEVSSADYYIASDSTWKQIASSLTAANGISIISDGINVLPGNTQLVANTTGLWIIQSNIDHDLLNNFVADEHVAHTGVDITAGDGLTGGGDISTSRTLNVLAGNSQVVANSTGVWIIEGNINHDNLNGFVGDEHVAHSGVTFTAGAGLTGGGTIAANRTFDVGAGNGITVAADAVAVDGANGISVTVDGVNVLAGNTQLVSNATGIWIIQSNIDHDLLSNFVADEHVAHSGVDITAGAGLTGGGNISASRTLDVGAANGITVAADSVGVDGGSTLTVNTTGVHVNSTLVLPTSLTIGTGSENVVANTTNLRLQNSTVTWDIKKPTAAQVTGATYYLAADSTWKAVPGVETPIDVNIDNPNTDEIYSWEFVATVSNEFKLTVDDLNANSYITSKLVVQHDGGTAADWTEYAILSSNASVTTLGSYSANANATHVRVYFAPSVANVNVNGVVLKGVNYSVDVTAFTAAGSDTQVQFNDATFANGSAGFTFNKTSNNVLVGNTISLDGGLVNAVANGTVFRLQNSTVTFTITKPTAAQVSDGQFVLAADSTWKELDHDQLTNFVADEHVAHSTITFTAGNGLTGGGTLAANRTFDVGAGDGISVTADAVAVLSGNSQVVANSTGVWIEEGQINHDNLNGFVSDEHVAHSGVTLTAGDGLSGGGTIAASRTFDVLAGNSQVVANSTGVWIIEGNINHDNLAGFVGNEHIDHSTVSITAGDGLTGGGTIAATRTLDVGAGNGITVAADAVSVDGANGISVTVDGVNVLAGNTQLVSNATGVWVIQSNIDHDLLSNFVADEHVAHSGVDLTAGDGLTGGGTIAASRSFAVLAGNSQVVANSTGVWIVEGNISHDNLNGYVADEHVAHSGVTFTAGAGLTGGGTIAANRTFDVGAGNGITVAADAISVDGANGISVTAAGVNVLAGNTQLVSNATGLWIVQSNIDHDLLANFVADEHVAHSGVTLTAGDGLTGGGTIAASRTFDVLAGNSQVVANSTGIWVIEGNLNHDNLSGFVSDEHIAHSGVTLTAGDGLSGGGTIAASRTFDVLAGNSQVVANSTGVWIIEGNINHDNLGGYVADEHIAHSGVTLTAGAGLTGGGTIAANRTFDVGAGNGITVAADAVAVDGANGISVTVDGVNVLAGNTQLVSNATGVWVIQSNIDHDLLNNFVADEHIDHTSVTLTAGAGLTGGGTIAANRTFDVGAGNGITVAADAVSVDGANGISVTAAGVNVLAGNSQLVSNATGVWITQSNIDHDLLNNFVADEHVAHTSVDLTAGNGLTGGGTIEASRSFAVVAGNTQLVSNATGVWITQSNIDHDLLNNFVADEHVAHSTITFTAGNGLTGGGTLAGNRTFDVVGANGISVTADAVDVDGGSTLTVNTTGVHVNSALVLPTSITIGTGAENTVLSTSSLTLQNSTVTFTMPKPTVAQAAGEYYLRADGSWQLDSGGGGPTTEKISTTLTGMTEQVIHLFNKTTYRSAEYLINISDGDANSHQVSKLIVLHATDTVLHNQYGDLFSNGELGTFTTGVDGANIELSFTPSISNTIVEGSVTYVDI